MQKESELYDLCRWNEIKPFKDTLKKYLNKNIKIDFSFDNSAIIESCIIHDKADILDAVLYYYKKMYLTGKKDDLNYKIAYHKLRSILEECVDPSVAEDKVGKILIKHGFGDLLSEEDVSGESLIERIKDFDEFDFNAIESSNKDQIDSLGDDSFSSSNQVVELANF